MMKNFLLILFALSFLNFSIGQNLERELLKDYDYFIETNLEKGEFTKYYLSNGLVTVKEIYRNNELQRRIELEYDEYNNVNTETETYNIKKGKVNKVLYKWKVYTNSEFYGSLETDIQVEENKPFDQMYNYWKVRQQEPNILWSGETFSFPASDIWHEFDENNNVIELNTSTIYDNGDGTVTRVSSVTNFKYDDMNNLIEIHREYKPKREFPIEYKEGQFLYEYEYFRYTYNDKGLWTKKYKTVNGEENLIAEREYK